MQGSTGWRSSKTPDHPTFPFSLEIVELVQANETRSINSERRHLVYQKAFIRAELSKYFLKPLTSSLINIKLYFSILKYIIIHEPEVLQFKEKKYL